MHNSVKLKKSKSILAKFIKHTGAQGLYLIVFVFSLISCGSQSRVNTMFTSPQLNNPYHDIYFNGPPTDIKIEFIKEQALAYRGTPYQYGGLTKNGIDCSGLIYTSFQKEDIQIPRISRQMAKEGYRLDHNEIKAGDLLFFQTNKNHNRINHVGLVMSKKLGVIKFIHATTSSGVIVSKLTNPYWKAHFVYAKRVLE